MPLSNNINAPELKILCKSGRIENIHFWTKINEKGVRVITKLAIKVLNWSQFPDAIKQQSAWETLYILNIPQHMLFALFYEYSCQLILVQIAFAGLVLEVTSVRISSCIQCSVASTVVVVSTPLITVFILLVWNHNMNIVTKQTVLFLVFDVLEFCNTRYENINA